MKCPKCGFNSFEENNVCPKCAADWISFKGTFGLVPLLFSENRRNTMAQELMTSLETDDQHVGETEVVNDMFSFDLPDDAATAPVAASKDPFDFNEVPASATAASNAFSFDDEPAGAGADPFASLLESTSQTENDPFSGLSAPEQHAPAASAPPASPGEFDLNSFSWDEPSPSATTEAVAKPVEDEFDSLFGDLNDTAKK